MFLVHMTVSQNLGPLLRRDWPSNENLLVHKREALKSSVIMQRASPTYLQTISNHDPCKQVCFVKGPVSPRNRPSYICIPESMNRLFGDFVLIFFFVILGVFGTILGVLGRDCHEVINETIENIFD